MLVWCSFMSYVWRPIDETYAPIKECTILNECTLQWQPSLLTVERRGWEMVTPPSQYHIHTPLRHSSQKCMVIPLICDNLCMLSQYWKIDRVLLGCHMGVNVRENSGPGQWSIVQYTFPVAENWCRQKQGGMKNNELIWRGLIYVCRYYVGLMPWLTHIREKWHWPPLNISKESTLNDHKWRTSCVGYLHNMAS